MEIFRCENCNNLFRIQRNFPTRKRTYTDCPCCRTRVMLNEWQKWGQWIKGYSKYLGSDHWKNFRNQFYKTHPFYKGKGGQLHHLNYKNLGHEIYGRDVVWMSKDQHKKVTNIKRSKYKYAKLWK